MKAMKIPAAKWEMMAVAAAAIVGIYIVYKVFNAGEKAAETVADAGKKVYDVLADDKNPVYDGVVGGAGRALTGDESFSLGSWFYGVTHKDIDITAPVVVPVKKTTVQGK